MSFICVQNPAVAALYITSQLVGIESFDQKKDFLKASLIVNTGIALGGIGLTYAICHLPFGIESCMPFSIVPISIVATAFVGMNTMLGGFISFICEKHRINSTIALMPNGEIRNDHHGIGKRLEIVSENSKQQYMGSCKTILETNVVTGFFMTIFPVSLMMSKEDL